MEKNLNENEVREVAQMQMKIDTYESFICSIAAMVATNRTDIKYLQFRGTELTGEMNRVWRFVKQAVRDNESKKDSETT